MEHGFRYLFTNSPSSLPLIQHPAHESGSTELAAVFGSSARICQIVPTVCFRGKSRLVAAIEPIETQDRDQIGSRYHENQRTSQWSIFLMFVLHIFLRIIQAANNSLVGAIGVPSPDPILLERKPETLSSSSAPTLIESRRARRRLVRNRTAAPSKV